jgi:hypothetical protein
VKSGRLTVTRLKAVVHHPGGRLKQRFERRRLKERLSEELSEITVAVTVDETLEVDPSRIYDADSSVVKNGKKDSGTEKFTGLTNEQLFGLITGKNPTHSIVRAVDIQKDRPVNE